MTTHGSAARMESAKRDRMADPVKNWKDMQAFLSETDRLQRVPRASPAACKAHEGSILNSRRRANRRP